ncbi:MAG: DUF4011 domain-containing protein, partial [Gaiellales bacterium]
MSSAGDHTAIGEERRRRVQAAVKTWTGELVDLGGRNNLLFYRDLKRGTLDLDAAHSGARENVLAGKTVRLSRLFPDAEQREDAIKRARTIRNKAQEHFEERGLQTLFLACGMATWTNTKTAAEPCSPVLLCPARLVPQGASQEDFDVALTGELEVNPTLLHLLQTDFNCRCDPEELLGMVDIEGPIDTPEEMRTAYEWLERKTPDVPGFQITDRHVLATFSYAKLPMVNDLKGALEELIGHELIAAIAGDDEARAAIRERAPKVEVTDPNYTPPADEFLVLDADASQNYAINSVIGGQDLIVRGPPGTGKSQTISNLIAALVARGKKVLFVAEKRAAIDAVLKRLDDVGLGDLVLDLHGGTGARRKVAEEIAATLDSHSRTALPKQEDHHSKLEKRRAELLEWGEALHHPREPWGVGVFDAQARVLGISELAHTEQRFQGSELHELGVETYADTVENLRDFVGRGGLQLRASGSPWASALVRTSDEGQRVLADVRRLVHETLPHVGRALQRACEEANVRFPEAVGEWMPLLDLWSEVDETLKTFGTALFEQDLPALVTVLEPAGTGAIKRATATIGSGDYRRAKKNVQALVRDECKLTAKELYDGCVAAAAQSERLAGYRLDDGAPTVPSRLSDLHQAHGQLVRELEALSEVVQRSDLATLHVTELHALLTALSEDHRTLAGLPELHRLRTALDAAHLGPHEAEVQG